MNHHLGNRHCTDDFCGKTGGRQKKWKGKKEVTRCPRAAPVLKGVHGRKGLEEKERRSLAS